MLAWIEQGAIRRVENEPSLERVELTATDFSLKPNEQSQLQVVAHYSDGHQRDASDGGDGHRIYEE